MTPLEHRYRRLIALYPAAHRRRYQKEMLSTLMDGASENQRAPRLRETIDLLWCAFWLRLNRDGAPPTRDPHWPRAAAIFGTLGAMVIAGLHLMMPLGQIGWNHRLAGLEVPLPQISWIPFAQAAAWTAVAVIALLRWRRIAAIVGGATVLATLAWAVRDHGASPSPIVREWTLIVFGVVVAGCLAFAKGPLALRAWQMAVFGGVSAACTVSLWADAMIAYVRPHPDLQGMTTDHWGMNFPSVPGIDTTGALPLLLFVAFLLMTVWIQYIVDVRVRWRLRAYVWVVLATYLVVQTAYTGYMPEGTWAWPQLPPLTTERWAALILVPLVTFGIAVIVVRRKDSNQRLAEIGRAHL